MSLKITVLTTVSMSISNTEQPSSLLKLIVIQSRMFRFRQFRTLTYSIYGVRRDVRRTASAYIVRCNGVTASTHSPRNLPDSTIADKIGKYHSTLHIHFRGLLTRNEILPGGAKFTLRPTGCQTELTTGCIV